MKVKIVNISNGILIINLVNQKLLRCQEVIIDMDNIGFELQKLSLEGKIYYNIVDKKPATTLVEKNIMGRNK